MVGSFNLLIRIPDTIVENPLMGKSGPVILWYIILNLLEVFRPSNKEGCVCHRVT